jgi:hypothetical protein
MFGGTNIPAYVVMKKKVFFGIDNCGGYYKPITIVNDDSSFDN